MLQYKIVETSTVTDEELERIVNEWVETGWVFEGFQFAMRESSKRPSMAFVIFTRELEEEGPNEFYLELVRRSMRFWMIEASRALGTVLR